MGEHDLSALHQPPQRRLFRPYAQLRHECHTPARCRRGPCAKGPDELHIHWTDVPRPDRPELTRVVGSVLAHPESSSDSLYTPVPAWRVWSLVCKQYANTLHQNDE